MERKINLESIILEAYGCKDVSDFKKSFDVSIQMVKEICIEACRQTLKLAAENAELTITYDPQKDTIVNFKTFWKPADDYDSEYWIKVDSESIINTTNQIE